MNQHADLLDFDGRTVWVTGANRGIGFACAEAFLQRGAKVIASFRSDLAELEPLKDHPELTIVKMDVSRSDSVDEAFEAILAADLTVDTLVNCAGIVRDQLFLRLKEDDWLDLLQTNLMGCVRTSKKVLRPMLRQGFGRIIQFSSLTASKPGKGQANYAASKAGLEAFSQSLACEVGHKGITVNCVAPGIVETDMTAKLLAENQEKILQSQIVKRFATPAEIAAWVLFLASETAGYMTGRTIHVDGGVKML